MEFTLFNEGEIKRKSSMESAVIDEAGMCVVNMTSIKQRIESMSKEEFHYVSNISSDFLTLFICLAHSPDVNEAKNVAFSMIKLLLNNIFDTDSMKNKFLSYKSVKASSSSSLGEAIVGSLDPVAILTNILNDVESEHDTLSEGMNTILSVLEGYNPLKLDDIIMLEKCNEGRGCNACSSLVKLKYLSPVEKLLYLLRCLNHRRFNFGGDLKSARASSTFLRNENNSRVVIINLKQLLLKCVDNNNSPDENNPPFTWIDSLHQSITRLNLFERAFISHVYGFLIFSRHRQQSGDYIKQFLYTVFARFLYSATEILFCANENASKEVDGGVFLKYIQAWTNISVMSSTLNTLKAYQSICEGSSVAPVLNLLSGCWKKHYKTSEDLVKIGENMIKCIDGMTHATKFTKNNKGYKPSLENSRSVRQAEKYIPYGFVEHRNNSLTILTRGISYFVKTYSDGNNFYCNCFHILSNFKGCDSLGADSADQATFVKIITPTDNGTGKMMGLITAHIDKTVLGTELPNPSNIDKKISQFMQDIIFTKTMVHEESVNQTTVPKSIAINPAMRSTFRCFDSRIYTLFLLWQRPCVEYPNISALTASQLELMLSRHPEWAGFITRIFFIIERVSFQLSDGIIKNIDSGFNTIKLLNSSNSLVAQQLIEENLQKISKDWKTTVADETGPKAQYTAKLYDILYEIVINNDMNPFVVIAYSNFLRNYVEFVDELLMKTL